MPKRTDGSAVPPYGAWFATMLARSSEQYDRLNEQEEFDGYRIGGGGTAT
jgi:hypothetical protein